MIDYLILIKRKITDVEKKKLISKNGLLEQMTAQKPYFDNSVKYIFEGGIYIKIDRDNKLTIKGSLHKYFNYLATKKMLNDNRFTMHQANETLLKLIENIGFETNNVFVTSYEIGANIQVSINPKMIFEQITSISVFDDLTIKKQMFVNASYKDNRHITTYKHKDIRVYYKMYDKYFEMKAKHKPIPNDKFLIRIETVNKKLEKTLLGDFMELENLQRLKKQFVKKWNNLNFDFMIDAPKGTHNNKRSLAKEIILNGKQSVIENYKTQKLEGKIPTKIFRNIIAFCNEWDLIKHEFKPKQSEICIIWANCYNAEIQELN
ncbi:hypothetical protein [Flavobacterium branchiophilum]|uniref:Uncharacterized protein n=1 Tax=Flavobacterium branchiophilum TaxID=55197 RepID=A0A2H3KAF9_9FLAO|nr:hypothetical protein [Flavobacterium branchiophilum]PDS23560.1 hypothetical protein B0A77_10670 [Flavobacterium branchiophilum]